MQEGQLDTYWHPRGKIWPSAKGLNAARARRVGGLLPRINSYSGQYTGLSERKVAKLRESSAMARLAGP